MRTAKPTRKKNNKHPFFEHKYKEMSDDSKLFSQLCKCLIMSFAIRIQTRAAFFIYPTSYPASSPSCAAGIIWPVECIPYPLRYVSLALPQTYASESLRCIMYRGNVCTNIGTTAAWGSGEVNNLITNFIHDVRIGSKSFICLRFWVTRIPWTLHTELSLCVPHFCHDLASL